MSRIALPLAAAVALLGGTSCGGGGGGGGSNAPLVYALTDVGDLLTFRADAPGVVLSSVTVTGLLGSLATIDFRPATGELYGIGADAAANVHTYRINTSTGVATDQGGTFGLTGAGSTSMDVNAFVDKIRLIVGDANYRVNPSDGSLTATDATLAYAAADPNFGVNPDVVGVAYSDNVVGGTAPTAFAIDVGLDVLVTLGGPNSIPSANGGALFTVGGLGINASSTGDFDIRTAGGVDVGYLVTTAPATSSLFTVNLATGSATLVGAIGTANLVVSIAVQP